MCILIHATLISIMSGNFVFVDNATKVCVSGPGLDGGKVNQPCTFSISTKEAGVCDSLNVEFVGPCVPTMSLKSAPGMMINVQYTCTEPGIKTVKYTENHVETLAVKFNNTRVHKFCVKIVRIPINLPRGHNHAHDYLKKQS